VAGEEDFAKALDRLEKVILDACASQDRWPAKITAGVCAGVDFIAANPRIARELEIDPATNVGFRKRFDRIVSRLAGFIRETAPTVTPLSPRTCEALIGGMIGLVSDHLRVGRMQRLADLRPELVLLALLPYVGFEEARSWANKAAEPGMFA
jgi:hypothetical protein